MKRSTFRYNYDVNNDGTGIDIKQFKTFTEQEKELLHNANLLDLADIEAWAAVGSNIKINYSTHGLFRYFGKFPATIASHLINEYTKKNDLVIDPMCGSGTTCVEALLMDRKCIGYDVNPLSILISKVKTTQISKKKLFKTLDDIKSNYKPLTVNEFEWEPVGLKNINHWFLEETQDSIRGIIKLIDDIKDEKVKDFFTISLASSIRPVSRATTQQGRLFLDADTAKEDAFETFHRRAIRAIERVDNLPNLNSISIEKHNSFVKFKPNLKAPLIIVHPPYFNNYKYSSVNSLELAWLKIDHGSIRKKEIREFFKIGKAENSDKYIEDMIEALDNMYTLMENGSKLALMIGDTVIKGEYIQVTRPIIDIFTSKHKDVFVEKVVLRVPKFTEASWASSQRRKSSKVGITLNDFIIIFGKREQ